MSPAAETQLPTSRITGFIALLLMALVAGTAGYFSNAAFAAQVDSAAAKAQAMVADITG